VERTWERNGFDTLGGLIMARLGHVPRAEERVEVEGAILTVQKMAGPRILLVHLVLTALPEAEG
jgi:CBS domain containing-hemolysin-like protein